MNQFHKRETHNPYQGPTQLESILSCKTTSKVIETMPGKHGIRSRKKESVKDLETEAVVVLGLFLSKSLIRLMNCHIFILMLLEASKSTKPLTKVLIKLGMCLEGHIYDWCSPSHNLLLLMRPSRDPSSPLTRMGGFLSTPLKEPYCTFFYLLYLRSSDFQGKYMY